MVAIYSEAGVGELRPCLQEISAAWKPRTVSWGMSVSPTRFFLLPQDGRATEEPFTDSGLTGKAELYFFFLSNKPLWLAILGTTRLQLFISPCEFMKLPSMIIFLGHSWWSIVWRGSVTQCLMYAVLHEEQFKMKIEPLPCWLSCFKWTHGLKRQLVKTMSS